MNEPKPMQRLGADPEIQALIARVNARAAEAAIAHEARMASLPPGTCSLCYGTERLNNSDVPCPTCAPTIAHAVGVPFEFTDASLENYDLESGNRRAVDSAKRFLEARQRDLFLWGGVGAGKTRLACSIANESFRRGHGGQFERVPMVLHRLQPGRDASDIREYELRLFSTPLLVLDDIGAERDMATDYTRRTLWMIYEERCDRGVRTIFTSNKSLDELSAMQDDDRLTSRIAGRADVVKLATVDQRIARRKR